jgi:hypothetical protein
VLIYIFENYKFVPIVILCIMQYNSMAAAQNKKRLDQDFILLSHASELFATTELT